MIKNDFGCHRCEGKALTMIRPATTEDLPRVVEILTAAFSTYVWTTWTIPSTRFEERLSELQAIYIEHFAMTHGVVYVNDDLTAVAAFIPARMPEPQPKVYERIAALHGDRFAAIAEAEQVLASKRPPHDWVLAAAGVDPRFQRQGLGQQVCLAGLHRIAADNQRCLVETSEPPNVTFYKRLGFEVLHRVETGGPTVWMMMTHPSTS